MPASDDEGQLRTGHEIRPPLPVRADAGGADVGARDVIACVRRVVNRAPARPPKEPCGRSCLLTRGRPLSDRSSHETASFGVGCGGRRAAAVSCTSRRRADRCAASALLRLLAHSETDTVSAERSDYATPPAPRRRRSAALAASGCRLASGRSPGFRADQVPWSRRRDARATAKAGLGRPSLAGPSMASPRRGCRANPWPLDRLTTAISGDLV